MKKLLLIFAACTFLLVSASSEEMPNPVAAKIQFNIPIPPGLSEEIAESFKEVLSKRIKFITKENTEINHVDSEFIFELNKNLFKGDELKLFLSVLTENIHVEFYEVLVKRDKDKKNVSYLVLENAKNRKEILPINPKGVIFLYNDFSNISIKKPSNKRAYMAFTIKKENTQFKELIDYVLEKYNPGMARVFASCSGLIPTAPVVQAPLDYEFIITFPVGKEFESKLIEMQASYPLPFEILIY